MSFKKFGSLSKINLLLILVLFGGGIGAAAFSTRVFSFENYFSAEAAAAKISVNEQRTPKKAVKLLTDKKETDESELLGGADGKLLYSLAYPETNFNANSVIFAEAPTFASAAAQSATAAILTRLCRPRQKNRFCQPAQRQVGQRLSAARPRDLYYEQRRHEPAAADRQRQF